MAVRMLWLVLGGALGACSGHTSTAGQTAEGGTKAMSEPEPPTPGAPEAGQSSGVTVAGSGAGGATIGSGGDEAAAGSPSGGSDAGASSQGGAGDSIGGIGGETAVEFPPRVVCGPSFNEYSRRYCPSLSMLSISLEALEDAGGDGSFSPGEEGRLAFSVHNVGPDPFVAGTCVGVLGATPGLTVLESYNPSPQLFGVSAGKDAKMKMRFRVEPDVAPGSQIPLLAWLDVQAALCPNGDELRFELLVAP
jgi:hypothetical protein